MSKPNRVLLVAVVVSSVIYNLAVGTPLFATSCNGVATSVISCVGAGDATGNPIVATLVVAIQILTGLIGIVAIGAFVYAGIVYASAGGVAAQVAKAKEIMSNTATGLVLFAGMGLLLNFLLPGSLFSGTSQLGATDAEEITLGGGVGRDSGSGNGGGSGNGSTRSDPGDTDVTASANFLVATYNIRATNLTSWDSTRANAILKYLKTVDVSGIQEGRDTSVNWLTPKMKSATYARTKNQWGRQVFWDTTLFTATKQGVKEMSGGKDLVWVKLKEKKSSKEFYFATTHLSVDSSSARTAELRTALGYINASMTDAPVIFAGDMNSEIGSSQDKQIRNAGFRNAYSIARTKKNTTYKTVLSGFTGGITGKIDTTSDHQIDHIYIKGSLVVQRIEIKNQRGSDHLPVEAAITIP